MPVDAVKFLAIRNNNITQAANAVKHQIAGRKTSNDR
jgi:hypothetical protein